MKKFLLTAVLILAVVTSLTAGTLAAYNQTLSITGTDVNTKEFNFTANGSKSFSESLKIAPGDKITYKVNIKNKSEVSADFMVDAVLSGDLKTGGAVVMSVYDGEEEYAGSFNKELANTGEFHFFVDVMWPYSDVTAANVRDTGLLGKTATLKITVNGTSLNEENVHGTIDPVDVAFVKPTV